MIIVLACVEWVKNLVVLEIAVYEGSPILSSNKGRQLYTYGVYSSLMKTRKMSVGARGEEVALQFLRSKGYLLYARNVHVGYGELDLILFDKQKKCLVFVEVKTRSHAHDYYSPSSGMHYRKKKNIYKAMHRWIAEHEYEGLARTDVVYVIGNRVTAHHEQLFGEQ